MGSYTIINGYTGSKAPYVSKLTALCDSSCTRYVETCVGSGALYFSFPNGKYQEEALNDVDTNIMCLYKALKEEKTRERAVAALYQIEKNDDKDIAMEQFRQAKSKLLKSRPKPKDPKIVEYATNAYIVFSQSFNCSGKSYSAQKPNLKYQFEIRQSIPKVVERLATQPTLFIEDVTTIIKMFKDQADTQMFIDPPYVGLYRNSPNLYMKEMSGLKEHIKMLMELRDSKAAVILCGYRCPIKGLPTIYDAILTGEEWHCFKISNAKTYKKSMVVKAGEKKQPCSEYVWVNRVPEVAKYYVSMQDYKEKMNIQEYWNRIFENEDMLIKSQYEEYKEAYQWMEENQML